MTDQEMLMPQTIQTVLENADCLFTQQQVEQAIDKIAQDITERCADSNPVMMTIMNGGMIFAGQLLTRLNFPLQIDYCHATRYRGEMTGRELHWKVLPQSDLQGRTVILIDDILDEGHTLQSIIASLKAQGALQVLTVVLTDKQHDRKADPDFKADFVGLTIPDRYVFGYGMDYKEYWRNAPGIFAVNL